LKIQEEFINSQLDERLAADLRDVDALYDEIVLIYPTTSST
jgi:hypothetical protein